MKTIVESLGQVAESLNQALHEFGNVVLPLRANVSELRAGLGIEETEEQRELFKRLWGVRALLADALSAIVGPERNTPVEDPAAPAPSGPSPFPFAEPAITINGMPLTRAQAMSVRVACGMFLMDLGREEILAGLGPIGPLYRARLSEVTELMQVTR